jgi:hypothetical protein
LKALEDILLNQLTLRSVILVATGVSAVYLISILIELPMILILGLCLASIVALVWMVVRLLKDQYSTDKTFDECFYQDR